MCAVTEITAKTHGCRQVTSCRVPVDGMGQEWCWADIDRCLAPLVKCLNSLGKWTKYSCCGHGVAPGEVILHDGTHIALRMCPLKTSSSMGEPTEAEGA